MNLFKILSKKRKKMVKIYMLCKNLKAQKSLSIGYGKFQGFFLKNVQFYILFSWRDQNFLSRRSREMKSRDETRSRRSRLVSSRLFSRRDRLVTGPNPDTPQHFPLTSEMVVDSSYTYVQLVACTRVGVFFCVIASECPY